MKRMWHIANFNVESNSTLYHRPTWNIAHDLGFGCNWRIGKLETSTLTVL